MLQRALLICAFALTLGVDAGAVTFTSVTAEATAAATTSGAPEFDTQTAPPGALPLVVSAVSVGGADVATAGAVTAPGLLTASADAAGAAGIASAVATASWAATFVGDALQPYLAVDFTSSSFLSGSGLGSATLYLTLVSGGVTLFQGLLDTSTSFSQFVAPGVAGSIDLLLTADASAGFPQGLGNAAAFGQVAVVSAVPLPATWLLFLAGLGPLAAMRKRLAARGRPALA